MESSGYKKSFEEEDFERVVEGILLNMQPMHNRLREEIEILIYATKSIDHEYWYTPLYKSTVILFFSLIESDIYALNQVEGAPGYHRKKNGEDVETDFNTRLKVTFKHFFKEAKKHQIIDRYLSEKFIHINRLKIMRDGYVHPKKDNDIFVDPDQLGELEKWFKHYCDLMHELMSDFFISTTFK